MGNCAGVGALRHWQTGPQVCMCDANVQGRPWSRWLRQRTRDRTPPRGLFRPSFHPGSPLRPHRNFYYLTRLPRVALTHHREGPMVSSMADPQASIPPAGAATPQAAAQPDAPAQPLEAGAAPLRVDEQVGSCLFSVWDARVTKHTTEAAVLAFPPHNDATCQCPDTLSSPHPPADQRGAEPHCGDVAVSPSRTALCTLRRPYQAAGHLEVEGHGQTPPAPGNRGPTADGAGQIQRQGEGRWRGR